jgi:hypothetical protein
VSQQDLLRIVFVIALLLIMCTKKKQNNTYTQTHCHTPGNKPAGSLIRLQKAVAAIHIYLGLITKVTVGLQI